MASSHRPARRRLPGTRALLVLATAGGLALAPLPASAAPEEPATSQEAAELLAARGHDLEVVTERFNEAREGLAQAQRDAEAAAAQVDAAEATLAAARERVATVARSAWTGDRLSSLEGMLTSDSPDDLLDRMSTLQTIADHGNELLGDATAAGADADAARTAAADAEAQAQELLDDVAGQQAALDEQVARFQADYDRLAAEEEAARQAAAAAEAAARAAAEQAAAEQAARAAAEQAAARAAADQAAADQAAGSQAAAGPAPAPAPAPAAAPAPRPVPRPAAAPAPAPAAARAAGPAAQVAVDTAMAQLGDPYVWAAAGPNAFDCSGLTQYAYAAAGISLPHSSSMQARMGTPVSRAELQPGDLVFFYSPVTHVGLYIGNGQMVHASTYGQPVKVAPVDSVPGYNSARRLA
ncbi:NlpC/P60 family protein [Blastococcus sp. URHD0036]|uniref:C40 family peptidase n=1 Tax=Blastococcus sp. URHD0036 TaxID=1380356 RepID=UPI00054EC7A2|nr:C40 family peptidase [Blastococcus sp. URHD0036]